MTGVVFRHFFCASPPLRLKTLYLRSVPRRVSDENVTKNTTKRAILADF
jgi:hypothetical protein